MMLSELITWLESQDRSLVLSRGFHHPHSYRGDYSQLAFEPRTNVSIDAMLRDARSALDATYEGYKGGSFTMGAYTDVYLANYGDTGEPLSALTLEAALLLDSYQDLIAACREELAIYDEMDRATLRETTLARIERLRAALAKAEATRDARD